MKLKFYPTPKQDTTWKFLTNSPVTHILYGGSVGSGKSYLGNMWIILSALMYPGTRYLIGRSRLNVLKRTTLKTFQEILKDFGIENRVQYNSMTNQITFDNGSEVLLMDLYPFPADVDYDRLGSLEVTGAFIDELSEISFKGFEVLFTRIRYKLDKYNLTPKLFCASNPTNGWAKTFFYKPFVDGTQADHVRFIQALPTDNKHLPEIYLKGLETTLTGPLKQRLLHGAWEFSDDEFNLFYYDIIYQAFYNEVEKGEMYISCDVANIGSDQTVIGVWCGLDLIDIYPYKKKTTDQVVELVKEKMTRYRVKIKNVIIDADGLGVGVADYLKGCVPFKGGSSALNKENYTNLRSQCYFKLSEKLNEMKLPKKYINEISQELQETKLNNADKETKTGIVSKDRIKQIIGRSPDYADMIMMRMYWEIKRVRHKTIIY